MKNYTEKIKKKKSSVVNLTSPSEKVIEILQEILKMDWISYYSNLKAEIEWSITMIKDQKIYQTNVRAVKEELRELVNWAVNQNDSFEPNSPTKSDLFVKIISLESYGPEIENLLAELPKWTFDVFTLEKLSESRGLEIIMCQLLSIYDLYHSLSIENLKFFSFIRAVQLGYRKENLYHNATHAADVVQSFYFFLNTCDAINICQLQDNDILTCFVSAAIHDYDHPGLNNLFLINSSDNLAIMYNDKSVLENYHVSSAYKLLTDDKNNFLERVPRDERKKYRYKIIALVLATDFSRHFADLGKFQLKFSNCSMKEDEDRLMAMEMLMHTSDIGNPSRPWNLCYEWATRVMNEFFLQGDKEKEMGLPVSNLCDRLTVNIPKSQIGFTELFIEPTFHVLEILLPLVSLNLLHITENKEKWKEMMENNKN